MTGRLTSSVTLARILLTARGAPSNLQGISLYAEIALESGKIPFGQPQESLSLSYRISDAVGIDVTDVHAHLLRKRVDEPHAIADRALATSGNAESTSRVS